MLYDLDQIRGHYGKLLDDKPQDFYERFDSDILVKRPMVRDLIDQAFDRLFPDKVGNLLDVGCGTCFYFPLLAPHAERVFGVDLCIPMLEQARQMIVDHGLDNCEVRESSALDLPFEAKSMDVVHSWDFLHHVPDVPRAIDEIRRVLKPGGRYVALEPNIMNPSILWYHARRRVEWRIFRQNQFTIPRVLRRYFDVKIRYDNTIISFLNARTLPIWKAVNALTSVPVFHLLSFRYIVECRLKP
jgi:ubiquinone/menaquinone biosynthesis C-methylase UbiE